MWLKYGVIDIAKGYAVKFYNSKVWKQCREAYKQSVNGLCESCLDNDKVIPGKELHHKVALTKGNINDTNITLSWSNLIFLCFDCHQKETWNRQSIIREGLIFNSDGDLVKQ